MNIWNSNSLILFIIFVIPGFVSIKTYELVVPSKPQSYTYLLIDAITYSCVNYAILAWPIMKLESNHLRQYHLNWYFFAWMIILFIMPICWAIAWKWLRYCKFFRRGASIPHPISEAWDYIFSEQKPYWIKATLKNGTKVGGLYDEKSFTSSFFAEKQIYLEESWIIN